MDMVIDLFLTALEIVVQLGVPLIVIFLMGFTTERASRRRLDFGSPSKGAEDWRDAWPPRDGDEPAGQRSCRLRSEGSPETRSSSPAERALPCWQSAKASGGRLRDECVECGRFLAAAPQ